MPALVSLLVAGPVTFAGSDGEQAGKLHIGWASADLTPEDPVVLAAKKAEARMERLTGRSRREQIAVRIADAVTSILPVMEETVDWNPAFVYRMERVELSRRRLSEEDVKTPRKTHHRPQLETVEEAFERLREEYRAMRRKIEEQPEIKQKRGWSPARMTP